MNEQRKRHEEETLATNEVLEALKRKMERYLYVCGWVVGGWVGVFYSFNLRYEFIPHSWIQNITLTTHTHSDHRHAIEALELKRNESMAGLTRQHHIEVLFIIITIIIISYLFIYFSFIYDFLNLSHPLIFSSAH